MKFQKKEFQVLITKKSFILAKYYDTYILILSTVLTKWLSNTINQSTLPRLPRERQSSILIPIVIKYSSNSSRVNLGFYWNPYSFQENKSTILWGILVVSKLYFFEFFFVFSHWNSKFLISDGQTDRRTDGQTDIIIRAGSY